MTCGYEGVRSDFGTTQKPHHNPSYCKKCLSEQQKVLRDKRRAFWDSHDAYVEHLTGVKACSRCKQDKTITDFYKNRNRSDGVTDTCKDCTRFRQREYYFGITEAETNKRLELQGNACLICEVSFEDHSDFRVDHCHTNGHVRGLLCDRCNLSIGNFGDNPKLLRNAALYLETFSQ